MRLEPDLTYRSDIDGLRAIAVLSVVFYHAGASFIPGGFTGVDMFFVISGYLITQRLVAGFQKRASGGTFTLKEFFIRRIRRLFPAMLATVLLSLLVGVFVLSPSQLVDFSKSAAMSILSVANIYFYSVDNYWGPGSETLPLLHFWSLAVEEQFYLVWPALIFLIATKKWRTGFIVLAVLFVVSLAVTTSASYSIQGASFYLTPFRIYEFVIGAACVWFDRLPRRDDGVWALGRTAVFIAGLALIGLSFVLISEGTAFPGWQALVPCVGTAAIILARNPQSISLLLDNPVARHFGLISYSLYLVHWPILVYANMILPDITLVHQLILLGVIYVVALGMYKLVETPLRKPITGLETSFAATGAFARNMGVYAVLCVSMVGLSVLIVLQDGFTWRVDEDRRIYAEMADGRLNAVRYAPVSAQCAVREESTFCGVLREDRSNIVVLGDSFGTHGYIATREALPGINLLVSTSGGCRFSASDAFLEENECSQINDVRRAWIDENRASIDGFVIANNVVARSAEDAVETAQWLSRSQIPVAILGGSPMYSQPALDLLALHGTDLRQFENRANWAVANDMKEQIADNPLLAVWEPRQLFCDEQRCRSVLEDDGHPVLIDTSHLSLRASRAFGDWLRDGRLGDAFDAMSVEGAHNTIDLPELPRDSVRFDGSNEQRGRITIPDTSQSRVLSIVIQPGIDGPPDSEAYGPTSPPMPMRFGSVAVYQLSDRYKLALNSDLLLNLLRSDMRAPIRIDLVDNGEVVSVFIDEVLTYTLDTELALGSGAYVVGKGFRDRYWAGEVNAFTLQFDDEVINLLEVE